MERSRREMTGSRPIPAFSAAAVAMASDAQANASSMGWGGASAGSEFSESVLKCSILFHLWRGDVARSVAWENARRACWSPEKEYTIQKISRPKEKARLS